jgi:hypothetical protein
MSCISVHFHHLDVFQFGVEILNFLARVVDFVPLEFSRLQGLAGGHRLVQIRAGRVDFFGEQERRVNTGPVSLPVLLSVGMYRLCS